MIDIVIYNKNEKGFIEMAKRLGYSGLVFLVKDKKELRPLKESLKNYSDIDLKTGLLLSKKSMKNPNADVVICLQPENARGVIERKACDFILGLEYGFRKDFLHHRNSGFNHVMASIASEKNVGLAFSFQDILKSKDDVLPVLLGRIKQNIMLARKYKVKTVIGSFASKPIEMRNPVDLKAFFKLLSMPTDMVKKSFILQ